MVAEGLVRRAFHFLRHGEADWNPQRLCIGQIDRPLTDIGRTQAEMAGPVCRSLGISEIYFSPLSRTSETAALIAHALPGVPLIAEPGLMEVCLGIKQGQREDNPDDPFLRLWVQGQIIQGAESYPAFKQRVVKALNDRLSNCAPQAVPLFVAHAGVYHALREAMNVAATQVQHCKPYGHMPMDDGWHIETYENARSSL